ncbi:MAG TPA: DUF3247 family protein [Casimicrobiaceae bacterium]
MARKAKEIFTEPGDIARIERLVTELPQHAHVRITLRNGDVMEGSVVERPTVQVFEDDACDQGINALVRIDDVSTPPQSLYLWLGDIERIDRLDTA